MKAKSVIRDIVTIAKFNLKIEMRYPLSYIGAILNLLFWILSFAVLAMMFSTGSGYEIIIGNMILWGIVAYLVFQIMLSEVAFGFVRLQRRGTLEQIFLTPTKEWILPLGLVAYSLVIYLIFSLLTIAFMVVFLGIPLIIRNALLGAFNFILFLIMSYGFALLFAGLMLRLKRAGWSLVNFIQFFVMIFGGVFYPFRSLPEIVLCVSRVIPFSYGLDLLRTSIVGVDPELVPSVINFFGFTISGFLFEELLVMFISALSLVIGYMHFMTTLNDAKRKGYLATY